VLYCRRPARVHKRPIYLSPDYILVVSTLRTAVNLNEEPRRSEYRSRYNIDVLAKAVCRFVRRPVTELVSIPKHAEGGFSRVSQATFDDDQRVLA
jgi:hypothetical protein